MSIILKFARNFVPSCFCAYCSFYLIFSSIPYLSKNFTCFSKTNANTASNVRTSIYKIRIYISLSCVPCTLLSLPSIVIRSPWFVCQKYGKEKEAKEFLKSTNGTCCQIPNTAHERSVASYLISLDLSSSTMKLK